MTLVNLAPAATRMAALVGDVRADQLDAPTPCPDYTVADLLDHIGRLVAGFTAAARKESSAAASADSLGDAARLATDWPTRIPRDLDALVEAWHDPAAYDGMTFAGGIELPGAVAGVVALEELVIHGWDLARAIGAPFVCDDSELETVLGFVSQIAAGDDEMRGSAFAGPVAVAESEPFLDRVVALSGRDPAWKAG